MKVEKVAENDLEACYCCMTESPAGASWTQALPESKKWFKSNLGKHVEGYHLLDGNRVVARAQKKPQWNQPAPAASLA